MFRALSRFFERALTPPKPRMPVIPAAEAPPADIPAALNQADETAAAAERDRLRRARGRASTILTSGQGDTSTPELARPAAGGAAGRLLLG